MKRITILCVGAALFAGTFALAEESNNLIVNGNAIDGLKNWKNVQEIGDDGPENGKCFEVTGSKNVTSQEFIEIDPKSEYTVSVELKSGTEKPNMVYVGLVFFDKNKRSIDSTSVNAIAKSETVLASDAKKGDKLIKIKRATGWETLLEKKLLMVVFDVDDSGEYSDLPNFNYYEATKMEQKDGDIEITLNRALAKNFVAGTKLRAHRKSGHLMYAFSTTKNFADWTKFSRKIKPAVKFGAPGATIWPNAKYAKALILANWGQKGGEVLKFTNFSLEKVESGK